MLWFQADQYGCSHILLNTYNNHSYLLIINVLLPSSSVCLVDCTVVVGVLLIAGAKVVGFGVPEGATVVSVAF